MHLDAEPAFFSSGGSVEKLINSHDWTSPLGQRSDWPQPLQYAARFMLDSKTAIFIAWGHDLCVLYNDAYIDVLGDKHPNALGKPLRTVWPEVWRDIQPLVTKALSGQNFRYEDAHFTLHRNGKDVDAWFTFSYTPLRDLGGNIHGFYCILEETTTNVLLKQRQQEESSRIYNLFESSPSFMAVVSGPELVYEMANASYLRFVGQRQLVGRSVKEVFPEILDQGYLDILDQVYATGEPFIGQRMPVALHRHSSKELDVRYIDFVLQPIRDASGEVNGVFIEGYDITEHVQVEERARNSEQRALEAIRSQQIERSRLSALLDAAPVGISFADNSGKMILSNTENRRIWGEHPMSENVDRYGEWKGWWADGSERHGKPILSEQWGLARALRGETVINDIVEIEPFNAPGERRYLLLRASPIRDEAGVVTNAVVAQTDISEPMRNETALRESEAKFRTITDAMPQMVWSTLPDGHHDYYNQQWYAFTGVPPGSTDGEGWNGMFHPEDQEHAWSIWKECLKTGEPYHIEYRLRHHSGTYRWVLGCALPVRDDKGKIIRWMGTCTDIHEQREATELLRQMDKRKDEFLAMLAHELRNPLAPITTAAQLLSFAQHDVARVREISNVISRQAAHMTSLIDDLLDVSRVTRGLITLQNEPVDIKSVVNEAVEQARPLIEAKSHQIDVLSYARKCTVLGDRKRLIQVIANLLTNAAKYTPNGGCLAVSTNVRDGQVTIVIRDSGVGMSTELLAHAFDLFVQGERTPDRSQGGLGIGLALVKSLVQLHGGTVRAYSEGMNKGTQMTVSLPCAEKDNQHSLFLAHENATAPGHPGLRLMIVDDNEDAGNTMAMLLQTIGYDVYVEYSASSALERARTVLPQICLLDIGLPDMDGKELAQHLRTLPGMKNVILVAITGYGQLQDKEATETAGCNTHFVKPVDIQELTKWLKKSVVENPEDNF